MRRVIVAAVAASLSAALAQVPSVVGYQGRLLKSDGVPEAGVVAITFALYDSATGGTAVGCDAMQVAVSDGHYAVLLGGVGGCPFGPPAIAPSVFDGRDLYLELGVGGTILSPRQRVASAPYAIRSGTAVNVRGGTVEASTVQVGGASGVSISSTGIQIGTTTVVDSSGKATVATGAGLTGNGLSGSPLAVAPGGVTAALLASDATSIGKVTGGAVSVSGGNVGIGTASPSAKLHVAGSLRVEGSILDSPLAPNLVRNSYMSVVDSAGKPVGFAGSSANVVLQAMHPFTRCFEGPYTATPPAGAAATCDAGTSANPYWFGVYNKGSRASRGGLADGWHSVPDGRILRITGDNSGTHTFVSLPYEVNVLTNQVLLKGWLKIAQGTRAGFGVDCGYTNYFSCTYQVSKTQAQAAPDGWYAMDTLIGLSEVTSLDNLALSMGIQGEGPTSAFEVYLALPYVANLNDDTWMPSITDTVMRAGLFLEPGTGNVGVGTTAPQARLDVNGSLRVGGTTMPVCGWFRPDHTVSCTAECQNFSDMAIKAGWSRCLPRAAVGAPTSCGGRGYFFDTGCTSPMNEGYVYWETRWAALTPTPTAAGGGGAVMIQWGCCNDITPTFWCCK